jgi:ABC-type hemin transport system ATPase subunit
MIGGEQATEHEEAETMTNAITNVEIEDFLVFKGKFTAEFCPGVNVLIGGNGTGKTTLLKYLWAEKKGIDPYSFKNNPYWHTPKYGIDDYNNNRTIFMPVAEMLTHSKGLLGLNTRFEMPFDQTEVDILAFAASPITRELAPNAVKTLDDIRNIIGGEVLYEDDTFYILSERGKIPFSLEASGYRKLGLLWKLLRNGLLENGSILFWDEPESSLNPELVPVLVDILLKLSRNGVQIFVATHSYDVARWFDLNKTAENSLRYFNLRKTGDSIAADVSDDYISLDNNTIDAADDKLLKRVVEVSAEKAGVKRK